MTVDYEDVIHQFREKASDLDPAVTDYVSGFVSYMMEQGNYAPEIDASIEFIRMLLTDAGAKKEDVDPICNKFSQITKSSSNQSKSTVARRLDTDIVMASQRQGVSSSTLLGSTDLGAVAGKRIDTRVDKKKLEKAERKIRAKIERRQMNAMKTVEYEASKLIEEESQEDYDDFYMKINPLDLSSTAAGKSKDIKLEGIDLYIGAGKRILSDTTLTLSYGHRYGLIGHNGVGKSTLLRALSRRELAVAQHITILHVEQEVVGDEKSVIQTVLDADVWRKHLLSEQKRISERIKDVSTLIESGEISEEERGPLDSEISDLDGTLAEVDEKLSEIESDKAESRAASILAGLGFEPDRQLLPTNVFSGGWRMRLSLARALFCKPDLLLLDEPSNMLDVPSVTFLANYLQNYPSTVLVVSHDRAFLNDVATDIIHQHSERLDYYRGSNFDTFYNTREERRKNQLREYESQQMYRKHLQAFIDKFRYSAARAAEAQSRIKKLEKLPQIEAPEEERSLTFRFPEVEKLSPPIIQLQNVTFAYENTNKTILKDVDLDVQLDSRIALVGPNGSGKSTLLKLLTGQNTPSKGLVSRNPRLRIGYFAQHFIDQLDLSLSAVGWMNKKWPGKNEEEYRRHLGAFGITGTLGLQRMQLLSGGQKARVAFACLGLDNPHILVLDEPSNHLDTSGLDALAEGLKSFEGGILMVSHDVDMIHKVCNQLWACEDGTVRKFPGDIIAYKKYILQRADVSTGVAQKQ